MDRISRQNSRVLCGPFTGTIDDVSDDDNFNNYRLLLKKLEKQARKPARYLTSKDVNMSELNNAAVGRN